MRNKGEHRLIYGRRKPRPFLCFGFRGQAGNAALYGSAAEIDAIMGAETEGQCRL